MAKGKRRATGKEHASPVSQTLGPARRASRASERERRRRHRRRRTTLLAGAGVMLVVALVAYAVTRVVSRDEKPPPEVVRTQRTVLLSVSGPDGAARAATLMAYDPEPGRAALVLIPPNTLTDVAGIGNVVLANALRLGGPTAARESVSDLMGVTVDHDWTLSADGFAALVDRADGIVVDVDSDVVVNRRVVVRAGGGQRLDGRTALAYATYVAQGQDQITFQARFQQVLEALFAVLPPDAPGIAASIIGLGAGSTTSWEPVALGTFVDGIRKAQAADRYEPQVLPVTPIDAGDGPSAFSIKVEEVATLVNNQLAASIPPGRDEGNNRVLILNGVGTPGLGASVARKMRDEFRVVGTRNKQGFGERVSVVVTFDPSEESLARARRLAELLGLPETAVRTSTLTQSVADLIVVIGPDYKP
ncbi:MAG TPA: LCP family protein [Frankiaceae bacterium]|nr:LCP family protein [Frankiaceae bacterium]